MVIYVDSDKRCHLNHAEGRVCVETDFFDGREKFVEGYIYDDSNGYVQIYPFIPIPYLEKAQDEYVKNVQYEQALSEIEAALGVSG